MTLKMKLAASISAFLLVLGLMLTGIFAANKVTINMGGSVTFNATDVYARITGNVSNDMSKPENLDVTYSADETPQGDDTVWNNLNLLFDDQATPIEIAITVENLSSTNTLRVNLDDKVTSSVANFNKAVTVDGQPYTNLKDITLQTNGSEDDSITFVITLSVEEKNNTIVADLNFQINLYDQNYVEPEELTDFVFDGYGSLISYTGADTDVVIPSSYSMIGQPTKQTVNLQSEDDVQSINNLMKFLKITHFNYLYNGKSTYYEYFDAFMLDVNSNTINFPCEIEYDDYSEVTFTSGNDIKVTAIQGAFTMNTTIETVSIPLGVTNIGTYAFVACSGLENVTIPDGVTRIGYAAFEMCSALKSIDLSNCINLTSILDSTFNMCSRLENVTIPDSVTSIGYGAFYECSKLTNIIIPDSVTSIGDEAFFNCSRLESVTFGENSQLTSIGDRAFLRCSNLTSVTINEYIYTNVTSYDSCGHILGDIKKVYVPQSVVEKEGIVMGDYLSDTYFTRSEQPDENGYYVFTKN